MTPFYCFNCLLPISYVTQERCLEVSLLLTFLSNQSFKIIIQSYILIIFIVMESRRQSEVIKQRIVRHNRLMKLIKSYNPSQQQIKKLERIKVNTMMEINIRYLRSDHNRYYRFPKNKVQNDSDSEEEHTESLLGKKENLFYDLRTQNQLPPSRTLSHKILSLDNNRKVASLEVERNNYQRQRLLRLHLKSTKQLTSKNISRKNSISDKIKREGIKLRLPELKGEKVKEYLKTEGRMNEDDNDLHEVIGKKLATQVSDSPVKLKGVEKYLKRIEEKQKESEIKSGFKKRVFLPDKI